MKEKPKNVAIHKIENGYLVVFSSWVTSVNGKGTLKGRDIHKEFHYGLLEDALQQIKGFYKGTVLLCGESPHK